MPSRITYPSDLGLRTVSPRSASLYRVGREGMSADR